MVTTLAISRHVDFSAFYNQQEWGPYIASMRFIDCAKSMSLHHRERETEKGTDPYITFVHQFTSDVER